MQREITMEGVFRAGFDAAWQLISGTPDNQRAREYYFEQRAATWLAYVAELEANAKQAE